MTETQLSWPGVQDYGSELDVQPGGLAPGFNIKPPPDDPPGFRIATDGSIRDDVAFVGPGSAVGLSPPPRVGFAVEDRPLGNNPFNFLDRQDPNVGPPPYTLPSLQPSSIYPRTTEMPFEGENRFSPDLYDPTYLATSPRKPLQEAFDQLSRIYAGVGLDPLSRFNGQHSGIRPTMLRGDEVSPAIDDAFDPRYVVPAQSPGGSSRPPPGHNNPPRLPAPPDPRPGTVAPLPQRPATEQPAPSPAGPAAAAEAALRQREDAYKAYREHLQQLDPEHPLLKHEPVPGVVPDKSTVDRYGEAVKGIVRKRVSQTIDDLSARSTYDHTSRIRTIGGDADLRAEFERLKTTGKRIYGARGQYAEGGDGEFYELPGGVRIGFRMANDTRTKENRSLPTLDIVYPGRGRFRFHYNNQR